MCWVCWNSEKIESTRTNVVRVPQTESLRFIRLTVRDFGILAVILLLVLRLVQHMQQDRKTKWHTKFKYILLDNLATLLTQFGKTKWKMAYKTKIYPSPANVRDLQIFDISPIFVSYQMLQFPHIVIVNIILAYCWRRKQQKFCRLLKFASSSQQTLQHIVFPSVTIL